jgi:hypothetical protein
LHLVTDRKTLETDLELRDIIPYVVEQPRSRHAAAAAMHRQLGRSRGA